MLYPVRPALPAASAFMRPSLVLPAAWAKPWALWAALRMGLLMLMVKPDCLNLVSVADWLVSLASVMFAFFAVTLMSPAGAIRLLPTWLKKLPAVMLWLLAEQVFTMNLGAACAHIVWTSGLFNATNRKVLGVLEWVDDLRTVLPAQEVPDAPLLELLALSHTAMRQPRDLLKIRRRVFLFMAA